MKIYFLQMFSKVTTSLSSAFWEIVVVGFLIPAMTVFFQTMNVCTAVLCLSQDRHRQERFLQSYQLVLCLCNVLSAFSVAIFFSFTLDREILGPKSYQVPCERPRAVVIPGTETLRQKINTPKHIRLVRPLTLEVFSLDFLLF